MFGTHGSGTGGTGFIGVQLAKALGAGTVITSTSGAANIAFAKSLGADRVFDYKVLDIFDPGALPDNSVDVVYIAKHFSGSCHLFTQDTYAREQVR